jgi:predicted AlkP superfamily pyrophosphatase or phosphodiesterase
VTRVCLLNVVALTPELVKHAPRLAALGAAQPLRSPLPAVTSTSQATLLTGLAPAQHGIVANGWLYRDTGEVRFWQQSNRLIEGEKLYEGVQTAQLFWWFNQGAPVRWFATPKPHYGADGSKVFDIIDATESGLEHHAGKFPFHSFWGPRSGLAGSDWIARASAHVLRRHRPQLSLVYLPHLDYDFQRFGPIYPERVAEVDRCAGVVIDAAQEIGARVVVVSEYGIVSVSRAVELNRVLRKAGLLVVRDGPFGEMLDTHDSRAFAVCDHQLAHVYLNGIEKRAVRELLEPLPGVDRLVEPGELELDHPRSGELVALAQPDAWFAYPYWLDDARAPDFARCVDIHRKPGFDPCELFATSRIRPILRLAQKALGFRYLMDVVPLDNALVGGSHGLRPPPQHGPLIIGPGEPPGDMKGVKSYVRRLLAE